ncbi:MAG: cytochrome-c peroxidase [Thermodesulfobacteriota bacterium]|nr:cytochrome-c peroxidase [Thermodesulfobacteriota bacterium]
MKKIFVLGFAVLLLAGVSLASASDGELRALSKGMFEAVPSVAPTLQGNPASAARLHLGHMLYFEPRLSASQLISCQTCHNVGLAGGDLQETSTGHGWQKGPRNAPTTYNAVFNSAQFWDGRAKDLAEQAKGPVQASVEMNNTPEAVVLLLNSIPEYVALFGKAFPGEKNPVTFDNMAKAIEIFEATLITPNDDLDRFMAGDNNALSADQKKGLDLFINNGCADCHAGVNLGGSDYFPFGVVEQPGAEVLPPDDKGRFKVTNTVSDAYVFRSPPLRNIALTSPYFHSGKVWTLTQAVAIMGTSQLGMDLNDEEVALIVSLLEGLSGDQPQVMHPLLPASTAKTPQPVLQVNIGAAH